MAPPLQLVFSCLILLRTERERCAAYFQFGVLWVFPAAARLFRFPIQRRGHWVWGGFRGSVERKDAVGDASPAVSIGANGVMQTGLWAVLCDVKHKIIAIANFGIQGFRANLRKEEPVNAEFRCVPLEGMLKRSPWSNRVLSQEFSKPLTTPKLTSPSFQGGAGPHNLEG